MLLAVPFATAHATASSALQRSAPLVSPEVSQSQEETPLASCPANQLCLYSGTNYTGTQFIAEPPNALGCGELVQPARSIINNTDTFFFVSSDGQCDGDARYVRPYSSYPDLGILARSLLYYCLSC